MKARVWRRERLIPAHAGKTKHDDNLPPQGTAHPRSRGENAARGDKIAGAFGSSPLTRGKHAGAHWTTSISVAHPRSRGENSQRVNIAQPRIGSSPLTRGKLSRLSCPSRRLRAHPRSRGENRLHNGCCGHTDGSSPLTRGKLQSANYYLQRIGLIPAHAGKTCVSSITYSYVTAHPRSRGENDPTDPTHPLACGSSPLTRGKHGRPAVQHRAPGLIPAHAGKTTYEGTVTFPRAAHPRSRGENGLIVDRATWQAGSSPLTRGKHTRRPRSPRRARLIPAHAGKTRVQRWPAVHASAHPRSRGENVAGIYLAYRRRGSSPLTRGKLSDELAYEHNGGLIPAHAGKTS